MVMGISHVAIRAKDIEKSAKFYLEVLGMKEAFRMNHPRDGKLSTIYLYVAPNQYIELFVGGEEEPLTGPKVIGPVHMCYEIDDAQAMQEELRRRGAPIDREITRGQSGCWQFWTHDPDGNPIELMQILPDSMQGQATARYRKS